ncbi:hypothetical protein [Helicobacter pylori]|uniref:hypothetical protein n=1 Tax=Helicobacter pylori TaxID=210 RepID=UPI000B07AACE|nr:hypothetical protein [Helicobacter pylori]
MGFLGGVISNALYPLKNGFCIKIKLKTPFLKIKERQVRLIQKNKENKFFQPHF